MAKSKNINLNLTPENEIQQTLFDDWRQSIDGYNGENPANPSNFEILDSEIGRINELLETISTLKFEKVNKLPDKKDAKTDIIYLVPSSESGEDNIYNEYIFLETENEYELIGSTQITFDETPTEGSQNAVTSGGVYTALQGKVDKEQGKSLSSNDYTDNEKSKLEGIESGAQVNVQADWEEEDPNSDAYIANKPTVPAAQVNADWEADSGVAEILNKPDLSIYAENKDLADVAFSGSYNDLIDKPTIPLEQVQVDWNQTDDTAVDYIKNKPEVPTNVEELTRTYHLSDILEDTIFVKQEYENWLFNFQINIIGDSPYIGDLFDDSYLLFNPLNDTSFEDNDNWTPVYGTIYYDKTTDSAKKLVILKFKSRDYTDPETGETTKRLSFDASEDLVIQDLSEGGGGSGMDITAQEIEDYFDEYCDIEAEVTEETIEGENVNVLTLENVDLENETEYLGLDLNASNVSAANKILDIE